MIIQKNLKLILKNYSTVESITFSCCDEHNREELGCHAEFLQLEVGS